MPKSKDDDWFVIDLTINPLKNNTLDAILIKFWIEEIKINALYLVPVSSIYIIHIKNHEPKV